MPIFDLMERPLLSNGFEKVFVMDMFENLTDYTNLKILYEDVRQYKRGPQFLQEVPEWLPLTEHVKSVIMMIDQLKAGIIPHIGPVVENVTLFYPKPDSSAKEIMVCYRISCGNFKIDEYGYFTLTGEPMERTPDGENKSSAKQIYQALFVQKK